MPPDTGIAPMSPPAPPRFPSGGGGRGHGAPRYRTLNYPDRQRRHLLGSSSSGMSLTSRPLSAPSMEFHRTAPGSRVAPRRMRARGRPRGGGAHGAQVQHSVHLLAVEHTPDQAPRLAVGVLDGPDQGADARGPELRHLPPPHATVARAVPFGGPRPSDRPPQVRRPAARPGLLQRPNVHVRPPANGQLHHRLPGPLLKQRRRVLRAAPPGALLRRRHAPARPEPRFSSFLHRQVSSWPSSLEVEAPHLRPPSRPGRPPAWAAATFPTEGVPVGAPRGDHPISESRLGPPSGARPPATAGPEAPDPGRAKFLQQT